MKGYVNRDDEGKIVIDSNGFITIACEDESIVFQLHLSEIDEKVEQMWFNVNGKDVYIDIYPGWETAENEITESLENEDDKTSSPSTSKGRNVVFPWCDASTKLFLKEYKIKRDLVKNRKLKNMKLGYQEISKSLQEQGYSVSPLQVENRFKTLKRAYKNMLLSNRRTGRGRYICSYEQELDELFATKHFASDSEGLEMNGKMSTSAIESDCTEDTKDNISQKTSTKHCCGEHNSNKNFIISNRLEIQNTKIIDSLLNCQRAIKTLTTKMDSRSKNLNEMQRELLQVYIEIRDMQKEANTRAEEQRQKTSEQQERRNNLLEEIIKLLKSERKT